MKQTILILTACLALASCASLNPTPFIKKFTKNNVGQAVYNPATKTLTVHYSQSELWEWKKAKANGIASANLCVDAVQGKVTGTVVFDSTNVITKQYSGKKAAKK